MLPRILLSLLIAGGFVWAMRQGGLPLKPPPHALDRFQAWTLLPFFLLQGLGYLARAYRLKFLMQPVHPHLRASRLTAIGFIGYGVIFFAPLRLGEMVRPFLLKQHEDVGFTEGLCLVAAERIIDGLMIVGMMAAGMALSTHLSPLPDHIGSLPIPMSVVPKALKTATWLFCVAFAGMAVVYALRSVAVGIGTRIAGRISPRLGVATGLLLERAIGAFSFLMAPRSAAPFMLGTVLTWVPNVLGNWVLLVGCGLPATPAIAAVATCAVALGSLLPAGPGFFGAYQIATYTSLAMYFSADDVLSGGAAFVFTSYVGYVVINVILTTLGSVMLKRLARTSAVATVGA